MFLCEYDILNGSHGPDSWVAVPNFAFDYHDNDGKEINNNFSHDNWTLVACWLKTFRPSFFYLVPIWGRHSWRPDNLAFFLYIRFPWLFFWLIPVISGAMIISMMRVWRTNHRGHRYIDTDGKIISYFKCEVFGFRITRKILDWIIARDDDLKSWENIFQIYFGTEHFVYKAFVNAKN